MADRAVEMLDEAAVRAWWLRRLHPSGPICPVCKTAVIGPRFESWSSDGLIECRDCGKWFDNRTGTPLSGVHADWRQLFLLIALDAVKAKRSLMVTMTRMSDDTLRRTLHRMGIR